MPTTRRSTPNAPALRATDENVPQALSGYRPTVSGAASAGASGPAQTAPGSIRASFRSPSSSRSFLGFRTTNSVKMAETSVLAGREVLRNTEQTVLLDAVTAYMDVILAQALLEHPRAERRLPRSSRSAPPPDRLNVGEGTRTDVAQTDARWPSGRSTYSAAVASLNAARANYQQVIGHAPKNLGKLKSIDRLLPGVRRDRRRHQPRPAPGRPRRQLQRRRCRLQRENSRRSAPADGNSRRHGVPQRRFLGSRQRHGRLRLDHGAAERADLSGRIAVVSDPPGEGNARPAPHRAGRDARSGPTCRGFGLGQSRCGAGADRGDQAQVSAEQLVLSGVIEERKVGQRTTLDVLTASRNCSMRGIAGDRRSATRSSPPSRCLPPSADWTPAISAGGPPLRGGAPLRAGPRQMVRPAHPRRALTDLPPRNPGKRRAFRFGRFCDWVRTEPVRVTRVICVSSPEGYGEWPSPIRRRSRLWRKFSPPSAG